MKLSTWLIAASFSVLPMFGSDALGQQTAARVAVIAPDQMKFRKILNGSAAVVTYRGRSALKLIPGAEMDGKDENMLAILDKPSFTNGSIELQVAGAPRPGMPSDSRGFIGLSFRTGEEGAWSEVIYLRPTNGRVNDQLRRNHAVQYVSEREYPWYRLRKEAPGVYESYVDLEPGAWTTIRIEVSGRSAKLFVNGRSQPTLVVNDLKHGDGGGRIALWAHVETDAHFGPIRISERP